MLLWLVLACLLPGAIGASALFAYQYREGRAQLEKSTLQSARALMQTVDSQLVQAQAVAQTLATSVLLPRGDLERFHKRASEAVARSGSGAYLVLRDAAGRTVLDTAVKFGLPLFDEAPPDHVRAVLSTAQPTISDVVVGNVTQRPRVSASMSVSVPVIIGDKVAYALSIVMLPEQLNALLKAQGLPANWVGVVIDSSGTIAGRTLTPEKFVGKKVAAKLLLRLAESGEGFLNVTSLEGTPVVAFYSRSPVTQWSVALAIPQHALLGELLRNLGILALGIAALFGVGLALAWFMGGRIARSVQGLIAPAYALGSDAWAPVPPVQVHFREAAAVAQSISRASSLLGERTAKLEASAFELAQAHNLARFGTWRWNVVTGEFNISASIPVIYGRDVPPFPEQRGTLLPVESWERMNAAAQCVMQTGEGFDLELQVNHGAGHQIWIQSICEAIRNEKNEVIALRGTIKDITERKRADERQRESENRFRLLADNIAQLAWMAEADGNIFWYNQRWFDYTGTALEQMQGWGWKSVHHPDHLDRVVRKFSHCLQSGEPWEDTFPLRGKDGAYRWFLSCAIPVRDGAGKVERWFGTNTDITEQRAAELAASQSQQLLKSTMDNFPTSVSFKDAAGRFLDVNRAVEEVLGQPKTRICGRTIHDFLPHADADVHRQHDLEVMASRQALQLEDSTPLPTGLKHHLTTTFPLIDAAENVYGTGHIAHDITARKLAEKRVRDASLHDSLTGLPNRAFVYDYGGYLLAAAERGHGRGALLFIDLDRFKPINDLYGHKIGDRVLQEVAKRLVDCTRSEDLVGRLGGDEFVVIMPNVDAQRHGAAVAAQHIVDSVSRPLQIDELELSLSPSVGVSYFPDHGSDVGTAIHNADLAMYQAKQSGRANYQVFTPELDHRAAHTHLLEAKLRHALKHDGELMLHYQPVIDIASGELIAAEALVRLAPDSNGSEASGPDVFIPVAESAGLIIELGAWVAAEACRQHALWRSQGLTTAIAVNVSPLQFRQRSFVARLKSIIAVTGMDPACLQIEVTESTLMDNVADAVEILQRIKSLGVKVALDDFGTGYSSLSSLSRLPLDKLKVDQSFVRGIEGDHASRVVTETIIALGHSLKLDVLAEGIESRNALRFVKEHGCNQAQGFWFSRPLPAAEFLPWARKHRSQAQARRART